MVEYDCKYNYMAFIVPYLGINSDFFEILFLFFHLPEAELCNTLISANACKGAQQLAKAKVFSQDLTLLPLSLLVIWQLF